MNLFAFQHFLYLFQVVKSMVCLVPLILVEVFVYCTRRARPPVMKIAP